MVQAIEKGGKGALKNKINRNVQKLRVVKKGAIKTIKRARTI